MAITVVCPNGHKLKAKDTHAGRKVACPICGATVTVPGPEDEWTSDESLPFDSEEDSESFEDNVYSDPPPSAHLPPRKRKATALPAARPSEPDKKPGTWPLSWLIAAGVLSGSVVAALVMLLVWSIWGGRSGPDTPGGDLAAAPTQDKQPVEVMAARPRANVREVTGKLRKIGLAFHNFHDVHRAFAPGRPRGAASDASGSTSTRNESRAPEPSNLSWRVHLLPYLDQKPLYDLFHLDEPWDSPHNKTLLDKMPDVYRIGSSTGHTTRIQVITGPDMLFGNTTAPRMVDVTDGVSHTILALVTGPDRAVLWTCPDELALDPSDPMQSLDIRPEELVMCVTAAGETLILREDIAPEDFIALATPHGKEIIDAGNYRRDYEERREYSTANGTRSKRDSAPNKNVASAAPKTPSTSAAATEPPKAGDAPKTDLQTRMHRIGVAFLMHNDQFGFYATPNSSGEFGTQLSWRVHLLPFLGEEQLYHRFHLNEPWDSPHNQPLLNEIPAIYRFDSTSKTRICVMTGPQLLFGTGRPTSYREIKDGPTNTLLALTVGADAAVEWTNPTDPAMSPQLIASLIQSAKGQPIECVTADGSPLSLPATVTPETLTALITPAGGEVVDAAALRKEHGPEFEADPALKAQIMLAMTIKTKRMENLKELGVAMHNYHDTHRQFPPAKNSKSFDAEGKSLLSWRVHLLPFLDQAPLYNQFKPDEPWDSPHNRPLLDKMPDIFRDPTDDPGSSNTRFVTLTGPGTLFAEESGSALNAIRDGTSQTILILQAGRDKAVPWTRPGDIAFDPDAPVLCLGTPDAGIMFVKADGAAQIVKSSIPPKWFQALVSPSGGEQLPSELVNFGLR